MASRYLQFCFTSRANAILDRIPSKGASQRESIADLHFLPMARLTHEVTKFDVSPN